MACTCAIASGWLHAAGEKSLDSDLEFRECTIGSGATALIAQCATLEVPLNANSNADSDEASLELAIARIPARRQSERHDAFTLIAGGPGQSAIETFPSVSFAFRHIMQNHDVILIDQRGTGSSAKLLCEEASDSMGLSFEVDDAQTSAQSKECLDTLDYDPTWFTTSMAVHDLEQVRKALGISQWNMYGISYGTRVALHYLRRYPDAVRTLILDAVVPPDISLGPEIAQLSQRALDLIFERCTKDIGCNEAFGHLAGATMELLESLEASPRYISFEDVASGKLSSMEFTRQHLAVTIRLMSYSAQTAAILPSMLHDAIVNDNFAPLARQTMLQTQSLGNTLATGMHHAVICTEDAPFVDKNSSRNDADTYLGEGVIQSLMASCEQWPAGQIDDDFKDPVISDVPTLILSGDADPITPPSYGNTVAEHLTNSRHIVNSHQGHMQAPFGCMPVLLAQFISAGAVNNLNVECLNRLRATPFFIDANGPLP
ncbi:MAG: alpha/beta fold hydrolase [Granulosicoccus sp.]